MRIFLLILMAQFPASAGFAADDASGRKTTVTFKKTESHRFSGLKLKGELKKPDLSYFYQRKGLRAEQIVNIPEHFNEEIAHGASQF